MSVYDKLGAIQSELFCPKGQRNDFGKYNYRTCEDLLSAIKPLTAKYKCALLLTNTVEASGEWHYVVAHAILRDLEDNSETMAMGYAREEETKKGMDAAQITGSCLSYARKYALAGLFCVDNERDPDARNVGDTKKAKSEAAPAASETATPGEIPWESVQDILNRRNIPVDYVCGLYKIACLKDATQAMKDNILKHIKELEAKYKGANA